ncbi:hypothetical protein WCWAEYFT_CDS0114 [Vibrio phage VB_VaC_TDDLMA]
MLSENGLHYTVYKQIDSESGFKRSDTWLYFLLWEDVEGKIAWESSDTIRGFIEGFKSRLDTHESETFRQFMPPIFHHYVMKEFESCDELLNYFYENHPEELI